MSQTEAISTKKKSHKITSAEPVSRAEPCFKGHTGQGHMTDSAEGVPTQGTMKPQSPPRAGPIFETPGKNVSAPKSHKHPGQHLPRKTHLLAAAFSPSPSPSALFHQPLRHTGVLSHGSGCAKATNPSASLNPTLFTCKTPQLQGTKPEGIPDTSKFTMK